MAGRPPDAGRGARAVPRDGRAQLGAVGYSFWNEPAPTPFAGTFALASVWAFFVAALVVCAIAYARRCAVLRPDLAGASPMLGALRAVRSRWWVAVPATIGLLALSPVLGPVRTWTTSFGAWPYRAWAGPQRRDSVDPWLVTELVVPVGGVVFVALFVTLALVDAVDGPAELVVLPLWSAALTAVTWAVDRVARDLAERWD